MLYLKIFLWVCLWSHAMIGPYKWQTLFCERYTEVKETSMIDIDCVLCGLRPAAEETIDHKAWSNIMAEYRCLRIISWLWQIKNLLLRYGEIWKCVLKYWVFCYKVFVSLMSRDNKRVNFEADVSHLVCTLLWNLLILCYFNVII